MSARDLALADNDHAEAERLAWMGTAPCRGYPTEWWFPGRGEWKPRNGDAAQICATCPYTVECASYARKHKLNGIWGGRSADSHRRLEAAVHGTDSKFRKGCRCPACSNAHTDAVRRWRNARKVTR